MSHEDVSGDGLATAGDGQVEGLMTVTLHTRMHAGKVLEALKSGLRAVLNADDRISAWLMRLPPAPAAHTPR